ncbi:MAG TPA: riboflavin synthase [Verrucomicrobiae bacterium]|jgi:riboflavin synthase|nr:riboflavin synthase [Verrucomicrobiae bacterium]
MFSGIVEEAGEVVRLTEQPHAIRLAVRAKLCGSDARIGDSIAVNGCCLTLVQSAPERSAANLEFDLLRETWDRTNLHVMRPGSIVNLERSLPVNGRVHGHFVTGHIDATGTVELFEQRGADWFLRVIPPVELLRYIAFKGSIALDGISLTVAEVDTNGFAVWIIPHTYGVTALRRRKPGESVNLEADILAKYVGNLVNKQEPGRSALL